mgnify:CR=1 FL=1
MAFFEKRWQGVWQGVWPLFVWQGVWHTPTLFVFQEKKINLNYVWIPLRYIYPHTNIIQPTVPLNITMSTTQIKTPTHGWHPRCHSVFCGLICITEEFGFRQICILLYQLIYVCVLNTPLQARAGHASRRHGRDIVVSRPRLVAACKPLPILENVVTGPVFKIWKWVFLRIRDCLEKLRRFWGNAESSCLAGQRWGYRESASLRGRCIKTGRRTTKKQKTHLTDSGSSIILNPCSILQYWQYTVKMPARVFAKASESCTASHAESINKTHLPFSSLWCISSSNIFAFAYGAAYVHLQRSHLFENGEQDGCFVDCWGNIPQSVDTEWGYNTDFDNTHRGWCTNKSLPLRVLITFLTKYKLSSFCSVWKLG